MAKRLLAAMIAVALTGATLMSGATVGAQERANPWFVEKYPAIEGAEITEVRPNGRVSFEIPAGRVYGDSTHDFHVIAGGDLAGFCMGDAPPTREFVGYRAGGEFVMRTPAGGTGLSTNVYAADGTDIFTWAFAACDAFFEEGTPLPSPVASGIATFRENSNPEVPFWSTDVQSPGFYRNGVSGTLSDSDGNLWDLRARVVFPLTGDEQGPPAFVQHVVSLTPAN